MAELNGRAVAAVTAGGIMLVSGIRGWSVSSTVRDILSGKPPVNTNVNSITGTTAAQAAGVSGAAAGTGISAIANDAMQYDGAGYVWGGTPASGTGHWDCSSFVSWVMGHDLRMAIPGYQPGAYTGTSHGPVALQYKLWSGAVTVPAASMQAGDLACWNTHIGIVTGPDTMISALNPSLGTKVSSVSGGAPKGETVAVRRVTGA